MGTSRLNNSLAAADANRAETITPTFLGPFHPQPLPRSFFEPSAEVVARRLLGQWLIRRTRSGLCGGPIVETEAYLAHDPACHSFRGQTDRNRAMFGPPGHAYVYFIYGNHHCVNAVCQPDGVAEAVLIRAVEPALGHEFMMQARPVRERRDLTNGPAKLCEAMRIDRQLDGVDLCERHSLLVIAAGNELDAFLKERGPIVTTTRIGIAQAAHLPLRFYLERSSFVSQRIKRRT